MPARGLLAVHVNAAISPRDVSTAFLDSKPSEEGASNAILSRYLQLVAVQPVHVASPLMSRWSDTDSRARGEQSMSR